MIVRILFIFLFVCTSAAHAGVLDKLDEVGDAVKPGSKDAESNTGEMSDGPADEKFSDFVKRARKDMETQSSDRHVPAELPEEKEALRKAGLPETASLTELSPGALKEAHEAAKGIKYGAKGLGAVPPFKEGMPELKNISKGAGKAADALKGARAIREIRDGRRSGASKAAELGLKYGAGKASGILAKPVTGSIEAAAQGMDKVNSAVENPTEEKIADAVKHMEEFQYEAAKNAGVDVKKIEQKAGGWKDWVYDQVYKFAPGWIPVKEKTKRDVRSLSKDGIDPSIFEKGE